MNQFTKSFLVLTLFICSIANAGTQKLAGVVSLNGKQLPVGINFTGSFGKNDQILVGNESFAITNSGKNEFGGKHQVKENGKVILDKSISIVVGAERLESIKNDPAGTAKELDLANKAEFQCSKTDNAILIIADNNSSEIIANCMVLE